MDEAKVREVCGAYRADLEKKWATVWLPLVRAMGLPDPGPFAARRFTDTQARATTQSGELSPGDVLQHLAYVCEETPRLMAAGRVEKAMRWLGWLQGAMWGLGGESLEDAKRKNMPADETYARGVPASQTVTMAYDGSPGAPPRPTAPDTQPHDGTGLDDLLHPDGK